MKLSDVLKARRKSAFEKLQALLKAVRESESKEFTEAQATEFDSLEAEIKDLEGEDGNGGKIAQAERAEPRPKEKLKADKAVVVTMTAQLKSKLNGGHPLAIMDEAGYGELAMELAQVNGITKSVNTLSDSAGGVLMPNPARGELLDLLYPEMTFLQGGPVRVPLIGGQYEQPFGASGGSASYVGEAAKKPITDVTFDKVSMKSKKLAAIVMITKEARKWLFPDVEAYVNRQLRIILPQAMNTAAYLGTGSGDTPTGIFNKSGVGSYAASTSGYFADVKAPTVVELDSIAARLILHMTSRFIGRTPRWAWVMSQRTLSYIQNLRVGANLDLAYPEAQGNAPTWKGIRVLLELAIPENTGTGTDETVLALVNFDDVLFGEEEGLRVDASDQATIDNSGTLVHLFQQNMMALLAEMEHDFGLQRAPSVVKLTAVRWGAP
jgi:HK97 family phage major capsid protein